MTVTHASPRPCAAVGRVLRCTVCGRTYGPGENEGTCPCAWDGILEVELDLEEAARSIRDAIGSGRSDILRYLALLPLDDLPSGPVPPITPVLPASRLAARLGIADVRIKYEGSQLTGALKDRASFVGVARATARSRGIACSSSGNAGISMAAYAAACGLPAYVFVPRRIPPPKLVQLLAYGAEVVLVDGPYEDAYRLCDEACSRFGWYNRNAAQNPYLVEGKKTCGLELAETLAASPADWIAVPIGDGCTITGLWKGLGEARALGFGGRLPRLLGVQAEGASAVAAAWEQGADEPLHQPETSTLADSIAVARPRNGRRALAAVGESGGACVSVTDDEIVAASLDLARQAGTFAEPASATTLAGLVKARANGLIEASARVVLVVTSIGLKDVSSYVSALSRTPQADGGAERRALEDLAVETGVGLVPVAEVLTH